MRWIIVYISVLFSVAPTHAEPVAQFDWFHPGAYWRWVYSELNPQTEEWNPYLVEKYTVTAVNGKKLTIEMSSSAYPGSDTEAHHKMILDFAKCELAAKNPRARNFTLEFFTRSLGPAWQVVARNHKNLVFTEKFNCWGTLPNENFEHMNLSDGRRAFRIERKPGHEASWYFEESGVAALKMFEPKQDYKFEFMDAGG